MTIRKIDIGQEPNDGTGDPIRTAFETINGNFETPATATEMGMMPAAAMKKLDGVETGAQKNPGVATTTANGVARQATEAEAVGGTANGAVFVTPAQAKARHDHLEVVNPITVSGTVLTALHLGKYTTVRTNVVLPNSTIAPRGQWMELNFDADVTCTITAPSDGGLLIRSGGLPVRDVAAGGVYDVPPKTFCYLIKTDSVNWTMFGIVGAASEAYAGVIPIASEADAVSGSNKVKAVTPYTANRSRYIAALTQLTNAVASGANFYPVTGGTLTLDDAVEVGKYFFIFGDQVTIFQPGPLSSVQIRGGFFATGAVGAPVSTPVAGYWGVLMRTSSTVWRLLYSPNADNAITARTASTTAAGIARFATDSEAALTDGDAAVLTLRTRAIHRLIGIASGGTADIASYSLGAVCEIGGANRVLLLTTAGIPNGAEYRVYAYPGSVIRIPDGVSLYGRGNINWSNTFIVGGGDWVAQYKMEGVLRKYSDTVWILIGNYQYEQATTSVEGVVGLATDAEVLAATNTAKTITPAQRRLTANAAIVDFNMLTTPGIYACNNVGSTNGPYASSGRLYVDVNNINSITQFFVPTVAVRGAAHRSSTNSGATWSAWIELASTTSVPLMPMPTSFMACTGTLGTGGMWAYCLDHGKYVGVKAGGTVVASGVTGFMWRVS